MKRWIKRGIGALTLCALLSVQTMAAEIALSFDKTGTTAAVQVQDVGSDRYAAEIILPLSSTQRVQFRGKADTYAITVDAAAGTVTAHVTATRRDPMPRHRRHKPHRTRHRGRAFASHANESDGCLPHRNARPRQDSNCRHALATRRTPA